jgi:hypothetical protein
VVDTIYPLFVIRLTDLAKCGGVGVGGGRHSTSQASLASDGPECDVKTNEARCRFHKTFHHGLRTPREALGFSRHFELKCFEAFVVFSAGLSAPILVM